MSIVHEMGVLAGLLDKLSARKETIFFTVSAGVFAYLLGGNVADLIFQKLSRSTTKRSPSISSDDDQWVKVGEVKELLIYPIKSVPPVSVNEATVGRLGLQDTINPLLRDRVFAIVNENGDCIFFRNLPTYGRLIHTRCTVQGSKLKLSYIKDPSMDIVVDVPASEDPTNMRSAMIYDGEKVPGLDCGDEVAAWLDRVMETKGLRLIYHVSKMNQRKIEVRNSKFETYTLQDTGAFQYDTSYMLMTEESVDSLNKNLTRPVSHINFRPNIFVSGCSEPFTEDKWNYVRIGSKEKGPVFKYSRPCIRCRMTMVDPETANLRSDGEPLMTLRKMKRQVGDAKTNQTVDDQPVMGICLGVLEGDEKVIRVGDLVYATYFRD